MTIISKSAKLVTFINVFTVEPANQQRLVELLGRVTRGPARRASSLPPSSKPRRHQGHDVRAVADDRGLRGDAKDPAPSADLQEALTFAKFEPGMYEVVETFVPGDGT